MGYSWKLVQIGWGFGCLDTGVAIAKVLTMFMLLYLSGRKQQECAVCNFGGCRNVSARRFDAATSPSRD